jgi:cellulose synthase operon protein YhjU
MGFWSFYFLIKSFLYFGNYFGFHFVANFAFAVFLIFSNAHPLLRVAKKYLAIPIGIALLYLDSPLPPIRNVIPKLSQLKDFSLQYYFELMARVVQWELIVILILLFVVYFFLAKKLRMTTVALLAMSCTLLPIGNDPLNGLSLARDKNFSGMPSDNDLNDSLSIFFQEETLRSGFDNSQIKSKPNFDIIFINICSLSWDDLEYVKETNNPLFKRFNFLLTDFNTAASYSGPSIIRLLRASIGQQEQKDLYTPPVEESLIFANLSKAGYQTQMAMNHDGKFGGLLDEIRTYGGLKAPMFNNKSTIPYLKGFDGSQIYDDYSVLSSWWQDRQKLSNQPVALFYNSISLHDGNRSPDGRLENSVDTYSRRLQKLLSDIDRFYSLVNSSDRKALIVFIPEHGAAIRRDKKEIIGLRELPSPSVTKVPVGLMLAGKSGGSNMITYKISEPTSYLAMSELIFKMVKNPPFETVLPGKLNTYSVNLPSTRFVSENEDLLIMRFGSSYYFHSNDINWTPFEIKR